MLSWLRREMLNSSHSCLKPSCSTLVFERKTAVSALQEREDFQPSNASRPHISSVHDLGHLDRRQIGSLLQGGLSLSQGKNLHTCIIQAGRETDIFLMNHLVNMYGKCGAFEEAVSVFDDIQSPNLVSWNVLMSTYAQHGFRKDTFQLFTQLQKEGFKPNKITFLSLLRVCDSQTALPDGRHIHLCVISNGLENDPIVGGALVTMYGKCEALQEAQVVFERSNVGDVVSWNSMISAVAQQGDRRKALKFFWLMLERRVEPDRITFTSVLHACDDVEVLEEGMAIHVCIIESGLDSDAIVGTALVNMYGKCGVLDAARAVFDDIKTQDVVSWTALITAYAQQEHSMDTLDCFQKMQLEGVKPNEFTFVSALNACASLTVLEEGKTIHAYVVESGFEHNCVVGTALVKMYSNCGALEFARMVFDDMRKRNVVTWTTMIDAYNEKGYAREALDLFWQMQQGQVKPDEFSCVSALTACTSLTALMEGLRVHDCIVDGGFEMNYFVQTALVKMYGDCGAIDKAQTVFDQLYPRDLVSWNAMLAVYAQQGHHKDSLQLFQQMLSEGMQPNATSFLSVLSACAGLAALSEGTLIHAHIVDCGFESDVLVANALINMYGRCGTLTDACLVFDRMHQRTVMTWTSMVAAYAQQGQAKKAVQVFQSMQHEGVKPDGIAFVTVLSACSHAGFIDDGLHFFASMSKEHGIIPTLDHYKCIIDLFGRSGRLKEAEDLITKMPLQPDAISWISLLSACKKHGDVTRGRWVAEQAIDLDSKYSAPYVLISNIYSIDENLEDEENLEIFVGKVS